MCPYPGSGKSPVFVQVAHAEIRSEFPLPPSEAFDPRRWNSSFGELSLDVLPLAFGASAKILRVGWIWAGRVHGADL
jgi:hypothetical protein